MGATTIPATAGLASDNWTLISSVTPTAGVSTVSFTSIGSYKKLMLKTVNPALATTGTLKLTFNSDTGTNYAYSSIGSDGSTGLIAPFISISDTSIPLGTGSNDTNYLELIINEINTSNVKTLSGFMRALGTSSIKIYPSIVGSYFAAAAITTVTLTASTTFSASGTVALYGVAI